MMRRTTSDVPTYKSIRRPFPLHDTEEKMKVHDSSYSSMVAKPPPKANDATPNGQQPNKAKNPSGPKRNPNRFLGHNQTDLKGILIPEDANAKHYNELTDRLETLG
eukprot:jgi/Psemu1/19635/gm1.19635_g